MDRARPILLIDGDSDSRKIYGVILEHAGYRVLEAGDGEEGLRLARHEEPALVLLELYLPGMDGLDVLEALRSDPRTREVPVAVLTIGDGPDDRKEALRLGCDAFLLKPCTPSCVLEEVRENAALRRRDAHPALRGLQVLPV